MRKILLNWRLQKLVRIIFFINDITYKMLIFNKNQDLIELKKMHLQSLQSRIIAFHKRYSIKRVFFSKLKYQLRKIMNLLQQATLIALWFSGRQDDSNEDPQIDLWTNNYFTNWVNHCRMTLSPEITGDASFLLSNKQVTFLKSSSVLILNQFGRHWLNGSFFIFFFLMLYQNYVKCEIKKQNILTFLYYMP